MYRAVASAALGASLAFIGYQTLQHHRQRYLYENETFENDFKNFNPCNWMDEPISGLAALEHADTIFKKMELLCMDLQGHLCRWMEKIDGKAKFVVDRWTRDDENGGGISCVLQDGAVFEKAGVNISVIWSHLLPEAYKQMRHHWAEIDQTHKHKFRVVGISSVNHPRNPHAPTMHFNFRLFEITDEETHETRWWFGGGCDLTPSFLYEDDAKHFHKTLKAACDKHNQDYYWDFKKWCDEYFFIKHRNEARGVGGIFFDDLNRGTQEEIFEFIRDSAAAVAPAYLPIVVKRDQMYYSDRDREWQLIRRGRYVEFNLIYDRGTKFGLYTPGARIESIFVSMPLYAKWYYGCEKDLEECHLKLLRVLREPCNWV